MGNGLGLLTAVGVKLGAGNGVPERLTRLTDRRRRKVTNFWMGVGDVDIDVFSGPRVKPHAAVDTRKRIGHHQPQSPSVSGRAEGARAHTLSKRDGEGSRLVFG